MVRVVCVLDYWAYMKADSDVLCEQKRKCTLYDTAQIILVTTIPTQVHGVMSVAAQHSHCQQKCHQQKLQDNRPLNSPTMYRCMRITSSDTPSLPSTYQNNTNKSLCRSTTPTSASNATWRRLHRYSSCVQQALPVLPYVQQNMCVRQHVHTLLANHHHNNKQQQAAKRLGMDAATVTSNLQQLQRLLPTLTPDLFKMNATHWARILHNVPHTAATLITFKSLYPGVDAGVVFKTNPKLLLKDSAQLEQDASQVYHILKSLAPEQRDAVLEAVPCLTDPVQLVQALGFLQHTFPNQNPLDILCADPTKVVNIEEADLEAEPLYGEVTVAG